MLPCQTCGWTVRVAACCAIIVGLGGGCASKAYISVWEPPELSIRPVRTVAVLDFRGQPPGGQAARSAIVAQLADNGYYALVDQSQLVGLRREGAGEEGAAVDVASAVEAARQCGVDAVLAGDVLSYGAVDDIDNQPRVGMYNGVEMSRHGPPRQTIGIGIETGQSVNREISAALAFQMIHTPTGEILASRQSSYTVTGQVFNGEGYLPARERTLAELMARCAADVVRMIAPHRVGVEVQLASMYHGPGWKTVRDGNKLALQGDWTAAAEKWRQTLEQNRGCHQAKYNLALAAARQGQIDDAKRLFVDATLTGKRTFYRTTLDDFVKREEGYRQALSQMAGRQPIPATPSPAAIDGPSSTVLTTATSDMPGASANPPSPASPAVR